MPARRVTTEGDFGGETESARANWRGSAWFIPMTTLCIRPRVTGEPSRQRAARLGWKTLAGEGVDSGEAHVTVGGRWSDIQMQAGCKLYKMELGLGVSRGECGIVGYRPMCRDVPITVSS